MKYVYAKIDSCTICPYEGTDDIHESMICTLINPHRPVNLEIPEWCPLSSDLTDMAVKKSLMIRIDSLLSYLKHRHGSVLEKIGEYQEVSKINDLVQEITRKR